MCFESTSEPFILSEDRYDGTIETGELKYNDTSIGSCYSGITPAPTNEYPSNSGHAYTKVLKLGTAELTLDLKGSCEVIIDAVSASSSASRKYSVYIDDKLMDTFTCIAGEKNSLNLTYTGDGATLKIKPVEGINVYGIHINYIKYPE